MGMVTIMTLTTSLVPALAMHVFVVNASGADTREEAWDVYHRPWNFLSFFAIVAFFLAGIATFLADICILAFDILDDEHNAIWVTAIIGFAFFLAFLWGCGLVVFNPPPIHKKPKPDPMENIP